MPDPAPTLKPREAPPAQQTPPGAPSGKPPGEADPNANGAQTLAELRAINQRLAAKDAHISRVEQENAELRKRASAPPPEDPRKRAAAEIEKGITMIDGGPIAEVIDREVDARVEARLREALPRASAAARAEREVDAGFDRLRRLTDKNPEELRLHEEIRNLPPDATYIASLYRQGKVKEARDLLDGLVKGEERDRARADVLALIGDESPEGRMKLRKALAIDSAGPGRPGQTGYLEGEDPELMFELSLAPHARRKNADGSALEWINDEGL